MFFTEVCNLTLIKSKGEQIKDEIVEPVSPAAHLTFIGILSI